MAVIQTGIQTFRKSVRQAFRQGVQQAVREAGNQVVNKANRLYAGRLHACRLLTGR